MEEKIIDYYVTPEEYEIAKSNGIPYRTVNARIRSLGWSKQRAIAEPVLIRDRGLDENYVHKAELNGISRDVFAYRIKHGYSNEEASTIPPRNNKKFMSELGKKCRKYSKELIQMAESNGISIRTFYRRIQKNKWDTIKAATTPLIVGKERAIMGKEAYRKIHGNEFGNIMGL